MPRQESADRIILSRLALDRLATTFPNVRERHAFLQEFLSSSPGFLVSLQKGVAQGDLAAIGRAAHTWKSTCQLVGALDLADACSRIEEHAKKEAHATALAQPIVEIAKAWSYAEDAVRRQITK